jgi:DNA-binding GntR family transcriptional regulator
MTTTPVSGEYSTKFGGSPDTPRAVAPGGVAVQRRVLRDGVYDAILEMLLEGQVPPGESLSIEGLARALDVSPTPVREALGALEHTGLVTRAALRGYRVSPPLTPALTADLIDARAVIEVAAIRGAMPATAEMLDELETVTNQHRSAAIRVRKMAERDASRLDWTTMRQYYNVDWDFHLVFLRNCHNGYLLEMAEGLAPHVHRLRQSMNHGTIDVEQAVTEHAAILEAVRNGNTDLAAAAMADHISAVRGRALADG